MCDVGHIVIELQHEGNPVKICSLQAGSFEIDFKREEIHIYHCECSSKCKRVECCNACNRKQNQICRGKIMSHQCKDAISSIRIVSKECYKNQLSTGDTNKSNPGNRSPDCKRTEENCSRNKIRNNSPGKKMNKNNCPNDNTNYRPCDSNPRLTRTKDNQNNELLCGSKPNDPLIKNKQTFTNQCSPKTGEHATVQCQIRKACLQNNYQDQYQQTEFENKTGQNRTHKPDPVLHKTKCRTTKSQLKNTDKSDFQIKIEPCPTDINNFQRKLIRHTHDFQTTRQKDNECILGPNISDVLSDLMNECQQQDIFHSKREITGSYQRESFTDQASMDLQLAQIISRRKLATNRENISSQSVRINSNLLYKDTLTNENGESFIRCEIEMPDCQSKNIIDVSANQNSKQIVKQDEDYKIQEYKECLESDDDDI